MEIKFLDTTMASSPVRAVRYLNPTVVNYFVKHNSFPTAEEQYGATKLLTSNCFFLVLRDFSKELFKTTRHMSVSKTSSAKLIQIKEKDALFADFRSALMLECSWKVKWTFFLI